MSIVHDFHFEEDTHTYRSAGIIVPSVTEVIRDNGLVSYAGIPKMFLERKARIGRDVHKAIELLESGDLDPATVPEDCAGYLAAWKQYMSVSGFIPDHNLIERTIVAEVNGMKYGMRCDIPGTIGRHPWLLEIKCTANAHPSWGIQLAGYSKGLPRPKIYRNFLLAAVQLKPNGTPRVHEFNKDAATNEHLFLSSLALTIWKKNHGLKTIQE